MGIVRDYMPVVELFASLLDYPSIVPTAIGWVAPFVQGCRIIKGFGKTFLAMTMIIKAPLGIADMDHALHDQHI